MADPQAPYCRLTGQIVAPAGGIPRLKLYARPIITQGVAKAGVSPADVQFATDDQGNIVPLDGAAVDVVAPGPGVNAPDRFQYQVLVYGPGLIEIGYLRAEQGKTIDLNTVLPGAPYDGGLLASRVHRLNTGGESASFDNPQGPSRVNDTGWMDIVEGAGKGKFKWRVLNGYVIVQPKLEWQNLDKNDAVGRWVRLVDIPKSVKVASRVSYPTLRLIPNRVDGAVEGDNSVVEIWPNNAVVMHATQGGGRIIPTVMAPVERPNQA